MKQKQKSYSLFSYRVGNSLIHKMPALIKLILMFIVSIRVCSSSWNNTTYSAIELIPWIRCAVYGTITLFLLIFAKTPFSSIKKLSYFLFLGLMVTFIKVFPTTSEELFYCELNYSGLMEGLLYTARFLISSAMALIMFETTSRLELLDSLEQIENIFVKIIPPIKKLHIAQIISVCICFIPEVFSTWNNISVAAKSRTPKKQSFKNVILNNISKIMALFYNLFQYADDSRKAIINRTK